MILAVVDQNTMKVINTIVADIENATPPRNCILVVVPEDAGGASIDSRWWYDDVKGEFAPPAAVEAERAAREADAEKLSAEQEDAAKR